MKISIYEADLMIDALTARAARYNSMACDDGISQRAMNRYETKADAMIALRERLTALKKENRQMAVTVA